MRPVVGVITNDQGGVFQRMVIAGARAVAERQHIDLVVDSQLDTPSNAFPRITPQDADGFLIIANAAPREFLQAAHAAGKPVSLVSHHIPDLPLPAVVFNNRQGILELVRHVVVDCQRSKLVFVRGISGQYDAQQREAAFREALMRFNLNEAGIITGDFNPDIASASILDFMRQGNEFNAVIAADYLMARAIANVLHRDESGGTHAISVVGFGDGPEAREAGITTVAADVEELGERAARQLIHQINGLHILGVTTLSVRLIVRDTSC